MKVLVIGGGVIGVTTAYYLARDGHEVTVLERRSSAAAETSYANAGLLAPAHAYAWASPKAPKILFKSLFMKDQALRLKLRADPRMWRWGLQFLAQCTERAGAGQHAAQGAPVPVLRGAPQRGGGRHQRRLRRPGEGQPLPLPLRAEPREAASRTPPSCASTGWRCGCWTGIGIAGIEPALEPVKDRIAGGLHAPGDQSGDARMFTRNLAAHWCTEHLGVRFEYGTRVDRNRRPAAIGVERVTTDRGDREAPTPSCSRSGHESPFLAAPHWGEAADLSLQGLFGHGAGGAVEPEPTGLAWWTRSISSPSARWAAGSASRPRPSSAGTTASHSTEDFRAMFDVARELFPERRRLLEFPSTGRVLRPMTPTTVPIFGFARYRNLMLNVGHGHIGWTMSCGSAKVVADLLAGRDPEIDLDGMLYT